MLLQKNRETTNSSPENYQSKFDFRMVRDLDLAKSLKELLSLLKIIFPNFYLSGSVVSSERSDDGWDKNLKALTSFYPFAETLCSRYYGLPPNGRITSEYFHPDLRILTNPHLSANTKILLSSLLQLRGPNIDIHVPSEDDVLRKVIEVIEVLKRTPIDGISRHLYIMSYFGRFSYIKLFSRNEPHSSGEVNIIFDQPNLRQWSQVSSRRQNELWFVDRPFDNSVTTAYQDQAIFCGQELLTTGSFFLHLARLLRSITIRPSGNMRLINIDSLISSSMASVRSNSMTFEEASGIIANLAVASLVNNDYVLKLIEHIGDVGLYNNGIDTKNVANEICFLKASPLGRFEVRGKAIYPYRNFNSVANLTKYLMAFYPTRIELQENMPLIPNLRARLNLDRNWGSHSRFYREEIIQAFDGQLQYVLDYY